ncbi:MAG TPA: ATP synthase A1 subunit C [Thermoplasmata archaeon]|jgi:V/A-type H+-transporting ATPase subunit C|nr:ATP synthase A1 subunit C [Thermoplasmata archaeon]
MARPVTPTRPPEWARYIRRVTRAIPVESGNYPYVTARVRAKKAALLTADVYERMLQMEIPQIARVLGEGAYKAEILALAPRVSGVDLIELATSRNLAAVYTQIIGFSEGELRQMIGWYLDRFDVQNIKTIVRGKLYGASATEIQEDIVAAGSMKESFIQSLIELPTLEEIFDKLDGTIYAQAFRAIGKNAAEVQKWNEWEDRVTQLYYENLLAVVPERTEGTRLMREFVRSEIDIVNLRTLLRLWASKAALSYDVYVDGGWELPKGELAKMASMDVNALSVALRQYALTEDLAARLKDLQALGVGQLVRSVEKLHLLTAGRYAHVHPLSVLPILDYIVRKDREVQNLRIIARGKESGLATDVIRDLLVI